MTATPTDKADSTEDGLREQLETALSETAIVGPEDDYYVIDNPETCITALLALLPPLPVLTWARDNPDAAMGLATGTMVAVPVEADEVVRRTSAERAASDIERAFRTIGNIPPETDLTWLGEAIADDLLKPAAAPPSGKAQD